MRATLVAIVVVLGSTNASAQKPPDLDDASALRRPKLAAGADTNSWEAYYHYGVEWIAHSPQEADPAFAWAARLDPTRPEPLFARWVTYWLRHPERFMDYLKAKPSVVESPQVRRVDSLYWRAMLRNPFVGRDLSVLLFGPMSDDLRADRYIMAEVNYATGHYDTAVRLFDRYIREDSVKNFEVRWDLALCHAAMRRFDSAAAQITTLLAELRRRSEAHMSRVYDSRELLWFSLGLLHRALRDPAAAREDLGQALVDNLAFYPAHAQLAEMALLDGDSASAVSEYAQAAELGASDGALQFRYAQVLLAVGRLADAEGLVRRTIALEPDYALPYFTLAALLEYRGAREDAVAQYRRYLERARRGDPQVEMAQTHIRALAP